MSNLKIFKIAENLFLIAGVKFILYQVVTVPKIRLKLIEEVLAWDYSTHQRMIVTSHRIKQTEFVLAN